MNRVEGVGGNHAYRYICGKTTAEEATASPLTLNQLAVLGESVDLLLERRRRREGVDADEATVAESHETHVVPEVDQVQQVEAPANIPEAVADPPEVGEAVHGQAIS